MRRWRAWLAGLLLGLPLLPSVEAAVRAEDYGAFWLWSGVAPQPVLARAETLYILQGQISQSRRRPGEGVRLIAQGISVPRLARVRSGWCTAPIPCAGRRRSTRPC